MTGMEHAIEQAARVLIRHPLSQPQGGTASGAFVLCGCGTVINGTSRDHAHAQARKHVARALADAGFLAPTPLREEWDTATEGDSHCCCGTSDEADVRDAAEQFGYDIVRRYVTDWLPVDRAEGDGSADQ